MSGTTQAIRVELGRVLATPGGMERITPTERNIALNRHRNGDWGDVSAEDWQSNDWAFMRNGRLFSVYHAIDGTKFWIITEADRSVATILLPEEY